MLLISWLVSSALQPLAWAGALVLAAWWYLPAQPRRARRTLAAALALALLTGWLPASDALLRPLENRYPVPPDAALPGFAGVLVLGGSTERAEVQAGRPQVALNDAAERLTMAVALMRQAPQLTLVYLGGDASLDHAGVPEADLAERFFLQQGLPLGRLRFERASRTTAENARLGAALAGIDRHRPWLLMSSAWHLPRAMAEFRAAGWQVTPYPVDFRTGARTPWNAFSITRGARNWQLLMHEGAGLAAAAVSGRRPP